MSYTEELVNSLLANPNYRWREFKLKDNTHIFVGYRKELRTYTAIFNPGDENFSWYGLTNDNIKLLIGELRLAIAEYYNPDLVRVRMRLSGKLMPTPKPSAGEKHRK